MWKFILFLTVISQIRKTTGQFGILEAISEQMENVLDQQRHFVGLATAQYRIDEDLDIDSIQPFYDFIIIGSGSAGSVLANRLSEIPHWNILLLEAGKAENFAAQIPVLAPALQMTHYNWNYRMEYQPNVSLGLENHRIALPRGRALGGSTVINYMIYARGNRHDYDRWAAQGNPGWAYKDILPYFLKSERANLVQINPEVHNVNGYQSVENIYQSPVLDAFIRSAPEMNLTEIDYNANFQSFGYARIQATVQRGQRQSVARAFLQPIRTARKNLHILTNAYVTKIVINPKTKQATGVIFKRNGRLYRVQTTKEIILSAGALSSPHLLMLSGIGPAKHLREMKIQPIANLPVGQFMKDHITFVGLNFLLDLPVSLTFDKLVNPFNMLEFLTNGTGPLTSLGGVEGIGYIKTNLSDDPLDIPDIELLLGGGSLTSDLGLFTRRSMNIRDDVYNALFRPIQNQPTWAVYPLLLHPKSTGYMKLQSNNPFDSPLFYGNLFTDKKQQDINTLLASIRYIQRLSNCKPFQQLGSRMSTLRIPGCEQFPFDSDDYWRCALRSIGMSFHHQTGTCKMGPKNDKNSVVDHKLRVHAVRNLRVADTSIIPLALGAHTNAPSMMVGEKAADIIKRAWGEL